MSGKMSLHRDPTGPFLWPARLAAILLITLLAPLMGGTVRPSALAVLAGAVCFCCWIWGRHPLSYNRRPLMATVWIAAGAMLVVFWPSPLWLQTEWGQILHAEFGLSSRLATPQPLVSWSVLAAGTLLACWVRFLLQTQIPREARFPLASAYCTFLALAVAVTFLLHLAGIKIAWWQPEQGWGWFPNRNQMGNVTALGAVFALGCALEAGRSREARSVVSPSFALLVLATATLLNGSRASLLLLGLGLAAVLFHFSVTRPRVDVVAISFSVLLVACSAVIFAGTPVLDRLLQSGPGWAGRSALYEDTLRMILTSPWTGIGWGNFASVFTFYRDLSLGPEDHWALHPESDWLWLWAEGGWVPFLAWIVVLLAAAALILPQLWRSRSYVVVAAAVTGILFFLHSLVDVPGHRAGSLWPALFLLFLALPSGEPVRKKRPFLLTPMLALVAASILIWNAGAPRAGLPTGDLVANRAAATTLNGETGLLFFHRAEQTAPLDWELRYLHGLAAARAGQADESVRQLRMARFLAHSSWTVPAEEGRFWLSVGRDDLALEAWRESLSRNRKDPAESLQWMLSLCRPWPELASDLLQTARFLPGLTPTAIRLEPDPVIFRTESERWLSDPLNLSKIGRAEIELLIRAYRDRIGLDPLMELGGRAPHLHEWLWRHEADWLIENNRLPEAWSRLKIRAGLPALPIESTRTTPELEQDARVRPGDPLTLAQLALRLRRERRFEELIGVLQQRPANPAYLDWLYAEAAHETGRLPEACAALLLYLEKSGGNGPSTRVRD
jgi:O-antigen ligase